jgi:signal transduction histidine kinase
MSPRRTARAHTAPPTALPACLCGSRSTRLLVELAHDLRSPLTAILTLAESLQSGRSGPLTRAQEAQLSLIHASALRLCETTSDTLELARGTEGEGESTRPLSIREVLEDVRATVLPMATEKDLAVVIAFEGHDRRLGRERGLRRVLLNLATNALKATRQGSVTLTVTETRGDRMEFAVTDTGPGLRLAAVRALWRPFQPTARGPHAIFSSSGLGLAICRKLVGEMGGTLTVTSKQGSGTRFAFVVTLPPVE